MYQADIIQNELFNLVGWKKSLNPQLQIAESLTQSISGLTYQGQHPLLTLDNLKAVCPDIEMYVFDLWDSAKPYQAGDKVEHEGKYYKAKIANTGKHPATSPEWEIWDMFSEWLEVETKSAILKSVQRFINEKILEGTASGILSMLTALDKPGTREPITPTGDFVGLNITPFNVYGVMTQIHTVSFMFDRETSFILRIISPSEGIEQIFPLTYTAPRELMTVTLDYRLASQGEWRIGYNPAELGAAKAIDVSLAAPKKTRYAAINPIGQAGMNAQLSVYVDYTSYIILEKMLFQDIIAKQVAVHFLRIMAFNPDAKINHRGQNINRVQLLYEIDGDSGSLKKSGLAYELQLAMSALKVDFSKLDNAVFKRSIGSLKYRTI